VCGAREGDDGWLRLEEEECVACGAQEGGVRCGGGTRRMALAELAVCGAHPGRPRGAARPLRCQDDGAGPLGVGRGGAAPQRRTDWGCTRTSENFKEKIKIATRSFCFFLFHDHDHDHELVLGPSHGSFS
jgi:hypothetical protein